MLSRAPGHPSGRRLSAAAVAGAAVVLLAAPGAFAHVSVNPGTAEPGGFTKAAFRVPNERDADSTVQVEIAFPAEHPLGHVSVQPVPGWKATVKKERLKQPIVDGDHEITEAVTSVLWEGGTIRPGEFQEFPLSLGPLPEDAPELVFKAVQTYSDGEVVRWIDVPEKGAAEPEHPAPVLALKSTAPVAAAAPAAARTPDEAGRAPAADTVSRLLGGSGLAVGLVALGWAAAGRRTSARRSAQAERQEEITA
ncbi:YcnI family protein [Streptomyces sp. NPDC054802]